MNPQDDDIVDNGSVDNGSGNGPLTPEERALAQRLARLGGAQAEPSPALDARILAAAHAASVDGAGTRDSNDDVDAAAPVAPMRRRSDRRRDPRRPARWPVVFGFAASLALACGIAWQLRPVPPQPAPAASEAAHEEPLATYKPPRPDTSVRMLPPKPLNVPVPPPPAAERRAPARRAAIRDATPADAEQKPQAFDDHFFDEAISMPRQAAPASEAAAAAAAPALQKAAPGAAAAPAPAAPPAANAMRQQASDAVHDAQAARIREEPAFAEPDEEVVPPATADSPDVRDAWLARIRELLRTGQADAARESLRAFRTRYPRHVLPEDLRALEE